MSVSKWRYAPERCDGKPCTGDCDACPLPAKDDEEEMKASSKVERTVFLDKCMVNQIVNWFLITIFDERNKTYFDTIKSIASQTDPMSRDLGLLVFTREAVDYLYKRYREEDSRERESWEADEEC